jgi:alpha-beta hydrolase superfamily lysophospholipase
MKCINFNDPSAAEVQRMREKKPQQALVAHSAGALIAPQVVRFMNMTGG